MNFSIWMPGGVRGGDPKAPLLQKKNAEKTQLRQWQCL